jgi:anti-anti-sigma factor
LTANGEAGYLPTTGGGPLAVGGAFTEGQIGTGEVEPGGMLLLYTDGILERPGRELAAASVELATVAADVAADRAFRDSDLSSAERVCTQTLELLTRVTGHRDDITLLAGQRLTPMPPFDLTVEADPQELAMVRIRLETWLQAARVAPGNADAIEHAIVELVTNSIEHAYRESDGTAERRTCDIAVQLAQDGRLRASVRDHGLWREPEPAANRGLGLRLTAALVDQLNVSHDEHGTTATLELALTRPARLLTADQLASGQAVPPPAQADPLLILDQPWAPEPRIRIDGPIDASTAEQVEHGVRAAGAAGTRGLTVDLTGVSHLASAGVAALHRQTSAHGANGTALRLYAPTASPADVILTLVELEHATEDPHGPDRDRD